jgi:hypothetical protein
VKGGLQVVPFEVEALEPSRLGRAHQLRGRLLGKLEVVPGVKLPCRPEAVLSDAPVQQVGGVLAHRLQQPVSEGGRGSLGGDEALVDKGAEQVCDIESLDAGGRRDSLRGFQLETAHEHGQPLEQLSLGCRKQVVGPVDHGCEGLLPREGLAATAGQEEEPPVEPPVQVVERHRRQAGGR